MALGRKPPGANGEHTAPYPRGRVRPDASRQIGLQISGIRIPMISGCRPATLPRIPMHALPSSWSAVALLTGLFLPAQPGKTQEPPSPKWDSSFDYTNLPASHQELWTPLAAAQVTLEQALGVAQDAESAPLRLLAAEMKLGQGEPTWHLQLFAGEPGSAPRRVNVHVSSLEPKVLKRLELRELIEHDQEAWAVLSQAQVTPEIAIELGRGRVAGDKAEAVLNDIRARKLSFVWADKIPVWKLELMGLERRSERPLRRELLVKADEPKVKQNLLLDRFTGEPLRGDEPSAREDGTWIFDFNVGEGEEITASSKVEVNYRLFLLDTQKIHDTVKLKRPETFVVSQAPLRGMTAGMIGMRVGGKRKIAIPYELAFGAQGGPLAPPRAMVVCDIVIESLVNE